MAGQGLKVQGGALLDSWPRSGRAPCAKAAPPQTHTSCDSLAALLDVLLQQMSLEHGILFPGEF